MSALCIEKLGAVATTRDRITWFDKRSKYRKGRRYENGSTTENVELMCTEFFKLVPEHRNMG